MTEQGVAVKVDGSAIGRVHRVRALAWSFAQRDLKSRFKDTALGWFWALAIPLATLAVYSVVFGLIFKTGAPRFGNSHEPIYAVWLFCGLVAFGFFSGGVIRGIDALIGASTLMRKAPVPAYAPVLGSLIAGGYQTLVEIALLLAVLAALGNVSATWLLIPVWAVLFFIFTTGIAMVFAIASAHLRDIAQITAILIQFVFFATPVLYPIDQIPPDALGGHLRPVLAANPIGHFVELFRGLIYRLSPGDVGDWLYLVVAAAIALVLGILVSERFGRDLAEKM